MVTPLTILQRGLCYVRTRRYATRGSIEQFSYLRILARTTFISIIPDEESKAIQDIYSICSILPDNVTRGKEGYWRGDVKQLAYTKAFARSYVVIDKEDWVYFHDYIVYLMFKIRGGFVEDEQEVHVTSTKDNFRLLMDSLENNKLYCTKELCHSRITSHCLEVLSDVSNGGDG